MISTNIIFWTGMLLATAFATATSYGFLNNLDYKVLKYLRFPTVFLFPTTLYFIMNVNIEKVMEFIPNILTFCQNNPELFDVQKVVKFITELPMSFWFITTLIICVYKVCSIPISFIEGYFQQNEYAIQSTSAILYIIYQIFASVQASFQIVVTSLQASFQIVVTGLQASFQIVVTSLQASFQTSFTGITSHFPIVCLCVLFSMGIVLLIGSLLFSKGKQQLAFVLLAIILAVPVSNWF
ncbi:hypothetical protein EAE96_000989 [Botrytis aclada]|nr:hypothetical protein EAE96_000989 [Botrytis aclada]